MMTDTVRGCFNWVPSLSDTGLAIFTITVKDSSCVPPGIILQQTFTIPIYIWPPTVGGPDTAICSIDTIQLNVNGGTAWEWTVLPGGAPITSLSCTNCKNPFAWPSTTTSYVVTSTAGNTFCNKNKDTVTIEVLAAPDFDLGPDVTTCIGDSIQLNVNLNPEPNTTYSILWTPNTFLNSDIIESPISKPTSDITYVVTVVPNGIGQCGGRDTINVAVLQGFTVFNNDTAICLGAAVQINAFGDPRYTYEWTPALGVSNPSLLNPLLTPSITGPHTYVVTATFPGCTDSAQVVGIDVQPVPNVFVGADQILCFGDTVRIHPVIDPPPSVYPSYTYNWAPAGGLDNPSVVNPVFTALATTTLALSVSTPAGCISSDDIKLEVVAAEFIEVSADTAVCPGDTAMLRVTGGSVASLAWMPPYYISDSNSFNPLVWPVTSTTYTVVARDTSFCLDTAEITVTVQPNAVVALPDSTRIYPGDSYQMDPGGNGLYFQWQPYYGLTATNIANPIATPGVNTRYFVTATTEFGCMAVDSIDVYVALDSYIDVPNAFSPGTGPNNTIKVVHLGDATLKSFVIYNRWGAKVFESSDINQGWDGRMKGEPQPMGVYVYMVEAVSPTGRKFVKQGNITLIR
jgi:gliding motility-associated-like protein